MIILKEDALVGTSEDKVTLLIDTARNDASREVGIDLEDGYVACFQIARLDNKESYGFADFLKQPDGTELTETAEELSESEVRSSIAWRLNVLGLTS